MGRQTEKTIKTKRIYKGRIVGLREDTVKLSTGKVAKREVVEHKGAVAVVAIYGKDKIVLIRQYRKPAESVIFEIPAGLARRGEKPVQAARRELEEETGFKARKMKKVFEGYASPGYSTEIIQFFLAKGLKRTKQQYDEDELIDVKIIPIKSCCNLIKRKKIKDNKTFIGIMLATKEVRSLLSKK